MTHRLAVTPLTALLLGIAWALTMLLLGLALVGRRTFVKGIGATAVAAAGLSHERGFAQNADAIAPLVAGAIVAGSVGVGDEIGSLEPGKRADIILLDVEQPSSRR